METARKFPLFFIFLVAWFVPVTTGIKEGPRSLFVRQPEPILVKEDAFDPNDSRVAALLQDVVNASKIDTNDIGIVVYSDNNQRIFGVNDDTKFIPASLTKILTAGACLQTYSRDYEFRTQLLADGVPEGKVLKGNLYLKGGGDPTFVSSKLGKIADRLDDHNITTVEGDIVIDDSRFNDLLFEDGKAATTMVRSWNAEGYPLFVKWDPPTNQLQQAAAAKQVKKSKSKKSRSRSVATSLANYRSILVSQIRKITSDPEKKKREFVVYRNMTEPDLYTGYNLREQLKKKGVNVRGSVKRGVTPADALVMAQLSTPLNEVMAEMMKASNNYMAEILARNVALERGMEPTVDAGLEAIQQFLDTVEIAREDYRLTCASGFSQQNAITPNALLRVLQHLKGNMEVEDRFLAALPIAGIDGTLKYRMRRTPAQGRIFAKTGYVIGAVALAGYAFAPDGRTYTFVFMYNGNKHSSWVKTIFDRLCVKLVSPRPPDLRIVSNDKLEPAKPEVLFFSDFPSSSSKSGR